MMLGMPASSSMAMPIGRRSHGGYSSVRKKAISSPTGTAISMAINEMSTVPYIGASAPNFSVTGFHASLMRKLNPNVLSASHEPSTSETMMPPRMMSTAMAAPRVR